MLSPEVVSLISRLFVSSGPGGQVFPNPTSLPRRQAGITPDG
ncbi:hypothetical protein SLI_6728 [Streptomyces lividans 1326]|uniref:Uncharacterized protein n=1 Tax=Streptomyces lividans 1326 TaxID=1200984 RepID=A0A7U9DWJ7_STRLI|nr:hypothetical protein SLI_6728 [Streptomyces lividans 1326]